MSSKKISQLTSASDLTGIVKIPILQDGVNKQADISLFGGGSFYQTVQNSGVDLTQRTKLNFTNGLTATDNSVSGRTDIGIGGDITSDIIFSDPTGSHNIFLGYDDFSTATNFIANLTAYSGGDVTLFSGWDPLSSNAEATIFLHKTTMQHTLDDLTGTPGEIGRWEMTKYNTTSFGSFTQTMLRATTHDPGLDVHLFLGSRGTTNDIGAIELTATSVFYLGTDNTTFTDNYSVKKGIQYGGAGYETTDLSLTSRGYVLGAKTFTGSQTFRTGTASAGTAPIYIPAGTLLGTPENTALEATSTHLYYTVGGVRYQLDQQSSGWAVTGSTTITGNTTQTGAFTNTFALNGLIVTQNALSSGWVNTLSITPGANTAYTSTAEFIDYNFVGRSVTWIDGTVPTQRFAYFRRNTVNKTTTSATFNDIYNLYVEDSAQGTGVTFIRNWAAGFSGNVYAAKLQLGLPSQGFLFSEGLNLSQALNSPYGIVVSNSTSNPSASSFVQARCSSSLLVNLQAFSAGFTTSGINVAGTVGLIANVALNIGSSTANPMSLWTNNTLRFQIDSLGSVVVSQAALSTSATDGFLYITTGAGAPTGVPTAKTGTVPMYYDTTNNFLYFYNSGWKKSTVYS